ncbi:MAG TPA: ABC transporter permease [Candidatus Lokiarchaeia archaeon]|nr:ABC transporter permease [Candidatus Lokiarchaeia archaeon]
MKHLDLKSIAFASKGSLSRIWSLFRNEIESLLRDRQSLLIVFLLPIVVMIPFWTPPGQESSGLGNNISIGEVTNPFGVLNQDTTRDWRIAHNTTIALGENLTATFMQYAGYNSTNLTDYDQGIKELQDGIIPGFLVIPDGFEHNVTYGLKASVTVVTDATNTETSATITANMEIAIAIFKVTHGLIHDQIFPLSFEKYASRSTLFTAGPFIFSIMIFGSGLLLASQCIVGDEPLRRTLLTPAGKLEVIFAKTLAYSAIHAVQIQLLMFIAMFFFNLPIYGSFYVPFIMLFLVALTGVMMGMFVSVLSKTRLQANQMFLLIFVLVLLALIFITQPAINDWMPMYQGMNGFNSYAYKGFDFSMKPWPAIALSIESALFLGLTIVAFHFKKTVE